MKPFPPPGSDDHYLDADEQRLRALLREQGAEYIDDAGFTAAVLGRLPAPRRARARRRFWLLASAALGGTIVALCGNPDAPAQGTAAWEALLRWSSYPVPLAGEVLPLGALLVLGAGLVIGWGAYAREG